MKNARGVAISTKQRAPLFPPSIMANEHPSRKKPSPLLSPFPFHRHLSNNLPRASIHRLSLSIVPSTASKRKNNEENLSDVGSMVDTDDKTIESLFHFLFCFFFFALASLVYPLRIRRDLEHVLARTQKQQVSYILAFSPAH